MTQSAADRARSTFGRYEDTLFREVAARLVRPRQRWPAEDLIEKMAAALDDPVMIDRVLKTLTAPARQLLKLIDVSRQPRWPVQALADGLLFLGHATGLGPVAELLDVGLLLPVVPDGQQVRALDVWLAQAGAAPIEVWTAPLAAERCRGEFLVWDIAGGDKAAKLTGTEADGLEWPLRLAALWQLARAAPLRQTQSGGLFKRDLDRLRGQPSLSTPIPESPAEAVDPALLTAELARALGILDARDEELSAGRLPDSWADGLAATQADLWASLFRTASWDPADGYLQDGSTARWLRPAGAALAAALTAAPAEHWLDPVVLADGLVERHPEWRRHAERWRTWCSALLLGVWHPLRVVESARVGEGWRVRLTTLARDFFDGRIRANVSRPAVQTLLVQPNLEVVLFRQGLTPGLIRLLTQFAEWKTLGLACTLALTAESVYFGLESGLAPADVQRTLERHSTRPLPDSVVETLRSWASKRERVQVYPAAVLLEFRTPAELELAVKQMLVDQAVTDRIGVVSSEKALDYTRFRLTGTRDYLAAEEPCVEVGEDGLTLAVHEGKADLLLGAEVRRLCGPGDLNENERTVYRLTLEGLRKARQDGTDLRWLDDWFRRRSGSPTPPTARLLFQGEDVGPLQVGQKSILTVPNAEVADGIERWPAARGLGVERLGPVSFAVPDSSVDRLKRLFAEAGIVTL